MKKKTRHKDRGGGNYKKKNEENYKKITKNVDKLSRKIENGKMKLLK